MGHDAHYHEDRRGLDCAHELAVCQDFYIIIQPYEYRVGHYDRIILERILHDQADGDHQQDQH